MPIGRAADSPIPRVSSIARASRARAQRRVDLRRNQQEATNFNVGAREPNAPTVISTFAGCGGSSLGYHMAGFRELLATGGTMASISSVSDHDVRNRKNTPPTIETTNRSPIEMFTLTVFWSTVVSDDRRLVSSPVFVSSKNERSRRALERAFDRLGWHEGDEYQIAPARMGWRITVAPG